MVGQISKATPKQIADYVLEVFNPVARFAEGKVAPAPRATDLTGKTIALFWNQKPGGDIALAAVAGLLESRYQNIKFMRFAFPHPTPKPESTEGHGWTA